MFRGRPRIGQELLDVPMGDMIQQMALAIAEAQVKLDANSIEIAQMMGGIKTQIKEDGTSVDIDTRVTFDNEQLAMLELGFTPTFYQFVDTIIEVKIAIKYTHDSSFTTNTITNEKNSSGYQVGGGLARLFGAPGVQKSTVSTTQVNATYSQKFSYSAEGSSLLRTKLVPIPAPAILEERIRIQLERKRSSEPPTT